MDRHRAAPPIPPALLEHLSYKVFRLKKGHPLQSVHHITAACLAIVSCVWCHISPESEVYAACLCFGHSGWVLLRNVFPPSRGYSCATPSVSTAHSHLEFSAELIHTLHVFVSQNKGHICPKWNYMAVSFILSPFKFDSMGGKEM